MIQMVSGFYAATKPTPELAQLWMLSPGEIEAEAKAVAGVVDLLPFEVTNQIGKWSPVAGLITTTAMIVFPRLMMEKQYYAQGARPVGPNPAPGPADQGGAAEPDYTNAFFPGAPVS